MRQKTNEKLGEIISAQEELRFARAADVEHGSVDAKELRDLLSAVQSEHAELGEKHEALRQVHAVMERAAHAKDLEQGSFEAAHLRGMLCHARSGCQAVSQDKDGLKQLPTKNGRGRLEVAARRLWDPCVKCTVHHPTRERTSVTRKMWNPMGNFCRVFHCRSVHDVVRNCIHELVSVVISAVRRRKRCRSWRNWWCLCETR